jgi:hypothetical protein
MSLSKLRRINVQAPKWSGHKISWFTNDSPNPEKYDPTADGPEVRIIRRLTRRVQPWYELEIAIAKNQRWMLSLQY